MENLELQLKQQIIEALNLEEITAEEIATDAPLFGEGLGLDSIDALETNEKEQLLAYAEKRIAEENAANNNEETTKRRHP